MHTYNDSMIIVGTSFTPPESWKQREYKPTYHPFYRPESAIFRDEKIPTDMIIETLEYHDGE